jgi:DegV family protein with EDD domain
MYEFLASHYESVVSIALSSKVSGTCNAATTAASRVAPRKDGTRAVTVLDSLSISAGQALIAIAAAELAKSGASADEVIAAVREAIPRTRAFALLGSVDYAVKGGRVPKFARVIANLLRLSIILATQPDGRVTLGGALWGRHNLTERFARFVARRAPRLDIAAATGKTSRPPHVSILIGHGDARGAGQAVAQHLQAALPPGAVSTLRMTDMGTALGVHGGPGTLIVGLQLERLPTPPVT